MRTSKNQEPRSKKQSRGAPFVDKVLEITISQLAEVGLAALSVPEIARLAGANKTSLYRRWPTKEALVVEAIGAAVADVQHIDATGDLRRDLVALATRLSRFVASPVGKALVRIAFAGGEHTELRALVRGAHASGSPLDVITSMWPEHSRLRGADIQLVVCTIAGAVLHRVFVEGEAVTAAFIERLVAVVVDGSKPVRARKPPRKQSNR